MPSPVRMPKFGLAMTEGTILRWLAADGDAVRKGEPIAEIETAKAVNELEAPAAGTLAKILLPEGETATVAEVMAWILARGETPDSIPDSVPEAPTEAAEAAPATPSTITSGAKTKPGRVAASPVARRLAAELGVDLNAIAGSGPEGLITKQDVLAAADRAKSAGPPGRLVRLSPMRKEIVQTVTASAAIPQIVLYSRADATALRCVRRYDDAILWCVARALKKNEYLNASFEDDAVRLYDEVNIGFPVSVGDGLVIAVIRKVDELSLAEIGAERKHLVARARSREITSQEISGGTFTVSNLSMYPVDRFKALISPPQAAILSVGRIRKEPVAAGSEVAVRPTIEFGLTADHRVADGVAAAVFLKDLVTLIESVKLEDV